MAAARSTSRPDTPAAAARDRRLAEAAVLGVVAFWGSNFVAMKYVVTAMPPVGAQLVRYTIAALAMLILLWRREGGIGLPRRDLLLAVVFGGLGTGGYQILWSTALRSVSAGESALLVAATPILVAVIAALFGADRLDIRKLIGILISVGGVVLVVIAGSGFRLENDLGGPALTILGDLFWAVYVVVAASLLRRQSALRLSAWAALAGTVAMVPLGAIQLGQVDLGSVPTLAWVALAASGLLSVAVGNIVNFRAVALLGPTRVTNYQFLSPLVAIVAGALVLGEVLVPGQLLGGAVIVAGILIARGDRLRSAGPLSSSGAAA
ncbi:MAG: DMT family transporter [Candidatus Limnocylindrales bacterium]